jgi:hypothetical protein
VRSVLDRAIDYIENLHLGEVTGSDVELLALPFEVNGIEE